MDNKHKALPLGVLLVLFLLPFGCVKNSKTSIPKVQVEKFEREYSNIKFQKVDSTLYRDTEDLLIPVAIEYSNEKYYISDNGRMKVFVFDENWGLIDSIGKGAGRGPGEILGIIDFEVSGDNIWIIDGPNLAIHKFNTDGEYQDSETFEMNPSRIVSNGDQLVTLNSSPGELFSEIEGDALVSESRFGRLIEDQEKNFMALFGHLESRAKGGFSYIPQHQSLIYNYNKEHEIDFISKRPDGQDFPINEDTESNSNSSVQAPKSDVTAFAADTFDGKLYVGVYSSITDKDYLDVYNRKDGEYIKTIKPPFGCVDFEIIENTFTCIERGERVVVYEMVEK